MRHIETRYLKTVLENHTRDMTGRIVAVSGTTSGTGYVCARELARLGATVLLLNRESERAITALERLRSEVPDGRFEAIPCDLQSFASVRAAAEAIQAKHDRLDVLCNNAAVMALPDQATGDGYDVQMQTNSISPFLLTKELLPLLRKSDDGRVVNHSSGARLGAPARSEVLRQERRQSRWRRHRAGELFVQWATVAAVPPVQARQLHLHLRAAAAARPERASRT
jgi:NAD(P)-dependent dehydrogenase (short-subunit alcohol dehydrogenase family)